MLQSIVASLMVATVFGVTFQGGPTKRIPVARDHSLTSEAYIQKGLPADDRLWTGEDYAQAASVLKTLAANDPTELPRYGSPASGTVFARIIAQDNLTFCRSDSLSNTTRLGMAGQLLQNVSQVLLVYASATTRDRSFDSELVELLRYVMDVCCEIVPLQEEILASVPANDPDRETRLKGREQMRTGMASIVSGCITSLTEKSTYRVSELVRLAAALQKDLPVLLPFLPPGAQREIPVRVRRMIEQESDPILKESLTHVAAMLGK